ncbi:MAG: hypothetical protein EXR71_09520 [Myxococcales bacterium]|nr:hypothetical protein [Myxococcales bacterium]
MFDNVGRSRKQSAGRTAGSVLLSLLFNGSILGLMIVISVKAPEIVAEVQEQLVAVDMLPPPPPPPPPAGGGKKKEKKEEEIEPEVVTEVPVLLEEAPPPVEDEPEGEGVKDGVVDGVKDGVVDGVKDGVLGGQLGGTGPKTVHYSEVQVKVRPPKPEFPEAARQLGLKSEKCIVHVVVGTNGRAETITFKACPELFKANSRATTEKYEWYPLLDGGVPVRAQFDLNFIYKLID